MQVNRLHFKKIEEFCNKYNYDGAYWDGTELTFYFWNSPDDNPSNDWLMPNASTGLRESVQKNEWVDLEENFRANDVEVFSYGFSLSF